MCQELIQQARQAFLQLEELVDFHRKTNVVPTLAATDIFVAASSLLSNIQALQAHEWLDEAPSLENSKE